MKDDLRVLISVLSNVDDKLKIAERYQKRATRLEKKFGSLFGSKPKNNVIDKMIGSAGKSDESDPPAIQGAVEHDNMTLQDFDPIYRKKDAKIVRTGAMTMLSLDTYKNV